MRLRHLAVLATVLTACACSSSANGVGSVHLPPGTAPSLPTLPGVPTPGATTTAAGQSVGQVSVRFVNLFTVHGKTGPSLDVYDSPTGEAAKPLLTDVAYGSVSDYVLPHLVRGSSDTSFLYALPHGEDPVADHPDAVGLGGFQDDGSHPQVTVLLEGEKDTLSRGPLGGLSFSERVEKGTDNGYAAPVAPPPPAGKGEFLADTSEIDAVDPQGRGLYLMIDSSCAPPINGGPLATLPEIAGDDASPLKSVYAIFAQPPGPHQVSAADTLINENLTCAQLTDRQGTSSFVLAAGQQVEVYVYGTSRQDLHLLFAPIRP